MKFRALIHLLSDEELEGRIHDSAEWGSVMGPEFAAWNAAANELRTMSGDVKPELVQFYQIEVIHG